MGAHRYWARTVVCCVIAVTVGCTKATKPPTTTPTLPAAKPNPDDRGTYVEKWRDSPEMFPRERNMQERRIELSTNWALRCALDENKVKVRAQAPSLQLTGDDSVDFSRTYEIVVVADDIPAGKKFLDVYDVRILPNPSFAVVRPSVTAKSLTQTQLEFLQETLARRESDQRILDQDLKYAEVIKTELKADIENATKQVTDARKAIADEIDKTRKERDDGIKAIGDGFTALSVALGDAKVKDRAAAKAQREYDRKLQEFQVDQANERASQRKMIAADDEATKNPTDQTRDAAKKAKEAHDTDDGLLKAATAAKDTAKGDLDTKKKEATGADDALDKQLNTTGDTLAKLKYVELDRQLDHLQEAWGDADRNVRKISELKRDPGVTKAADEANKEFVTALREAIDTLKKKDVGDESMRVDSAISVFLQPHALRQLEHFQIDVRRKTAPSVSASPEEAERCRNLRLRLSKFCEDCKAYKDQLEAVVNPPKDGKGTVQTKWDMFLQQGETLDMDKAGIVVLYLAAFEVKDLEKQAKQDLLARYLKEMEAVSLTPSQELKAKSSTNFKEACGGHLEAVKAALRTVSKALEAFSAKYPSTDSFSQMADGDIAVFRFNVLRGIVRTTAFLLSDDSASGLFGQEFANRFYAAQVTFHNPGDKPILVYEVTMRLVVRMTSKLPPPLTSTGPDKQRLMWWATYQPLDADAVRRVLESSDEHSWKAITSKMVDFASLLGSGIGAAFSSSIQFTKGVGLFSGVVAPSAKRLLEEDLKRHAQNFRQAVLDKEHEIAPGAVTVKYVFLPKGPIFGDYAFDPAVADTLSQAAEPAGSRDFAKKALMPTYIYNIRREEVYVEGKRILKSDPLTPIGAGTNATGQ